MATQTESSYPSTATERRLIPSSVLSYLSVCVAIATLLLLSEVTLWTSLRTSAVIIFISSTGLIVWLSVLKQDREILFPEAIGMGLALGFLLCAGSLLMLRPFGFGLAGGAIPILVAHSFLVSPKSRVFLKIARLRFEASDTAIVLFSVFFGLYLGSPLLLLPALLLAYIAIKNQRIRFPTKQPRWRHQLCGYLWINCVVIAGLILIALTTTAPAPFIFSSGTESIPREAWSNSIVTWGPNENIALFGNPLRYHWFSFAVFGLITRLSGLAPMVLFNSGLSAVIDCLAVGSIIWTLTYYLSLNRRTALLSVVLLYGIVSLNEPYAVLTDSSPDATSWLVWVAAFAFALTVYSKTSIRAAPLIFATLGIAVILSNGGYGSALVVGLFGWLIGSWVQADGLARKDFRSDLALAGATVATMTVAYYLFLTPSSYSTSTIDVSFRFLQSWRGALFVITFYFSRFIVLPTVKNFMKLPISGFFFGLAIAGIPAFFVYRNSTWSLTAQFVLPALVLFPIPTALALAHFWTDLTLSKYSRWFLACLFLFLGISLQILFTAIQWRHYSRFNAEVLSEFVVIIPPIAIFATGFAILIFLVLRDKQNLLISARIWSATKSIFVIATVICSLGVGIGYSMRGSIRDLVDIRIGRTVDKHFKPTTSNSFRSGMLWLRTNAKLDDRLATNFICGTQVRDFYTNCKYQNSYLAISAISQRRVLIEGDSWGNVGLVFTEERVAPRWLNERVSMSHNFASQPDGPTTAYMLKMNIKWFIVDKSKEMPNTWEPYASKVFENSDLVILRIN